MSPATAGKQRPFTPLRRGEHPRERAVRERREDAEAIEALELANGRCDECGSRPPALRAVRRPTRRGREVWLACCINPFRCARELRKSLREAA